ncbi:phage tail tape measure protein [Bacteroides nordii]|uniref:phage tail tape measure protein n=2 Tax=Bacteroides nordii TaxID=291645 RepID=UPI003522903B
MQVTQWILELVDRITSPLHAATDAAEEATRVIDDTEEVVDRLGETSGKAAGKLEGLGKGMFFLNQLKEGVDNIRDSFNDAIEPGIRFETAVAEMSGITNMEGKELDVLAGKARNTAKAFGVDAANAMGVYKDLLSKITPELKKAPDALEIMSNNVMTLSKTMQNDVPGASAAMSTAMNQYKVSLDDPMKAAQTMTDYMNIMAAGTVEGSAEIKEVAEALKQTGSVAKTFGVEFAETNSAIQLLDKSGKKGSEGGIALRNTIVKLQAPTTDAVKQLKAAGVSIETMQNQSLSLTDRLRALTPVMHNATIMSALFGGENLASAMALIDGVDQIDTWTEAIQGSTSAVDMAGKQMDTYAEKQKRMQVFIDDLKISFFEFVEPIAPVLEVLGVLVGALVTLGTVAWSIGQIMTLVSIKSSIAWLAGMAKMVVSTVTSSALISTAIYSIPIIGWIALAITAITALVAFLWNKFAGVRAFFYALWNFIKVIFTEYYKFIFNVMKAIVDVINPANWFDDDFHFSDVWDRLSQQALEGGKKVGSAFSDGWKEGMADFDKSHPKTKTENSKLSLNTPLSPVNEPTLLPGGNSGSKGEKAGLGGSGGGNVRNITMNVTFNNHFKVSGNSNMREITDKVKRELLALLTDTVPAIG